MSARDSLSPNLKSAYDAVLGNPVKITIPSEYEPDCLYQSFISAISAFESRDLPNTYLKGAFKSLSDRVSRSRQSNATACFDAFKTRYARQISQFQATT